MIIKTVFSVYRDIEVGENPKAEAKAMESRLKDMLDKLMLSSDIGCWRFERTELVTEDGKGLEDWLKEPQVTDGDGEKGAKED